MQVVGDMPQLARLEGPDCPWWAGGLHTAYVRGGWPGLWNQANVWRGLVMIGLEGVQGICVNSKPSTTSMCISSFKVRL